MCLAKPMIFTCPARCKRLRRISLTATELSHLSGTACRYMRTAARLSREWQVRKFAAALAVLERLSMHQPSIFWRREVFNRVGLLNESKHYTMDFDYWVRMARYYEFRNIDRKLSCATYHEDAKTGDGFLKYQEELSKHAKSYWPSPFTPAYWQLRASMVKHLHCLPLALRLRNSVSYRFGRMYRLLASGGRG